MKFLVIWWWTPEHAKEVTERFIKWKQQGNYKVLYPTSTMIGRNKAFAVGECDDIMELYKDIRQWTDIATFDIIPIETSRDLVAKFRPT
mgnify:CR=1 FL=1